MTNSQIFEEDIKPMVMNALKGYNVTILAYGQTSSGKTHTISGSESQPGLISLAANELFRGLDYLVSVDGIRNMPLTQDSKEDSLFIQRTATVSVQFMEIYNEFVNDLLDPSKKNLEVREHSSGEVYVHGLTKKSVQGVDEFMNFLR